MDVKVIWSASLRLLVAGMLACPPGGSAEEPRTTSQPAPSARSTVNAVDPAYTLGPGDQVTIWALGAEEISDKPLRIDNAGYIDAPLVGRVHAGGLTLEQLKEQLVAPLGKYVREPQVTVSITDFGSQPVSVIGAVNKPGVYQLRGRKTLVEVLSMAEGARPDAGSTVRITRRLAHGRIPLPSAKDDPSGQFSVAEVSLPKIVKGKNPEENVSIEPQDVISIPKGETVYVIGEVHKAGAFELGERQSISVLQALSLAEGMNHTAAGDKAKILRLQEDGTSRTQIAVDLHRILEQKDEDLRLRPEDVLFVPNSRTKNVALRAAEAALSIGTGVAIWRVGLPRP